MHSAHNNVYTIACIESRDSKATVEKKSHHQPCPVHLSIVDLL